MRDALAEALDLPGHRLRVVAPDVGGGFGGKGSLYPEEIFVCAAARQLGRSVKWTSDRLEDLIATSQAFDEIVDAELALDATGRMLALRADVIGDVGAYSIYPWTAALEPVQVVSFLPGPYRIEHYRGRVRGGRDLQGADRTLSRRRAADLDLRHGAADGHGGGTARPRSDGDPPCAISSADEFPLQDRLRHRLGQVRLRRMSRRRVRGGRLRRRCAPSRPKARAAGRWFGIGIACYAELTGIGSRISVAPGMPINTGTETATIRIDSTGAVTAAFGVASHGQGLETTLAQIVAEHLGARVEDIRIVQGDSAAVAGGTGTYASRSTVLAGGAARLAAEAVREKVLNAASHLLEAAAADLVADDGAYRVAGTDRAVTFREVARAVYSEMGRLPPEARDELAATKTYDPVFGTTTSATHIAARRDRSRRPIRSASTATWSPRTAAGSSIR